MWGLSSSDSHFPLIYLLSDTWRFPAAHVIEGDLRCGKLHGHSYRVEVTIEYAEGLVWASLVGNLVAELSGRNLNDMMPGSRPDPIGIATWFSERLQLHIPLYEVNVWQDEVRATVRRE